jgi:hypothetical protein
VHGEIELSNTAGSVQLARQIDFAGKSGAVYRYNTLEEDRFLPPVGANYIIARITARGADLLFAGETESLAARDWQSALEAAHGQFGGEAEVLTRLNVRSAIRKAEREDLIEAHAPPLNAG